MQTLKFSTAIENNLNKTKLPWSQDCSFSKSLLSFHDDTYNPDFHRRNSKASSCLAGHLGWRICGSTGLQYSMREGISAFIIGAQGCQFSFPEKKNVVL